MIKILKIKRHLLKKILVILGVSGAGLMASCAKYGSLVSIYFMKVKGTVKSKESSEAIRGIQVDVGNSLQYSSAQTDTNGVFSVDSQLDDRERFVNLHISDTDGALNGSYQSKDTVIMLTSDEIHAQLRENIDIKLVKNE